MSALFTISDFWNSKGVRIVLMKTHSMALVYALTCVILVYIWQVYA